MESPSTDLRYFAVGTDLKYVFGWVYVCKSRSVPIQVIQTQLYGNKYIKKSILFNGISRSENFFSPNFKIF